MLYPNDFEQKIGFSTIKKMLKEHCSGILGEEYVDKIFLLSKYDKILNLLQQTNEFCQILQEENNFEFGNAIDTREGLLRIKVEGLYMDENELSGFRTSLESYNGIVSFFKSADEKRFLALRHLFTDAISVDETLGNINRLLDKYGKIKDNASPKLLSVRREMLSVQGGISRTLQSILQRAKANGYVEKDMSPVMRDGRLAIPVIPSYKRQLKGIVLDESTTGKTVFIEPSEVVEANNRLRELESEERREIIRILVAFSSELRPYIPDFLYMFEVLGELDFIRAKAKFAIEIEARLPHVTKEQHFSWVAAKHPLLYLSHKRQKKEIVPLNIKLTEENRILLISGPNAGGKSVCLKTVGLLQYMLQCGLLVPMKEESVMCVFDHLFIDIGDEQSIENDLSTYSSHLSNMKFFLKNGNEKTLILIDEFGTGTEPHIGGAIAETLLDHYNRRKYYGVITTHYTNLKHFAEDADGIVNGAMLYDRHHMQPLFELQVGVPGSSFAIEIARKIGLPEEIIAQTIEIAGSETVNFDKHLQDVIRDKHYWENKRKLVRQKEKQLDEITERYRQNLETLDSKRKEILKNAQNEASDIVRNANAQVENTIRLIKESNAEKDKTKEARRNLSNFHEQIKNTPDKQDNISVKVQRLNEKKQKNNKKVTLSTATSKVEPLEVGDYVKLKGQTNAGIILETNNKNAIIAFGQLKMTAKLSELEKVTGNQLKQEKRQIAIIGSVTNEEMRQRKLNFKQEIDVRGMRADEALQAVMYFIDDAISVNVSQVRILHGTGTGALRQVLREYLQTVKVIERVADEHVQFGGAGITVVTFNS